MGALAQAGRQQDFLLLPGAVPGHVPLKELPGEVQFPEDGEESRQVRPLPLRPTVKAVWQKEAL